MATVYLTDASYAYKVDEAGVVTRWTDPVQNNAYFLTLDPDGLVVWGQPQERVEPAQAAGQRLDTDMGLVDDYWGTSDLPGSVGYQYTIGAGPAVSPFFDPFDGPGGAYDPVTGTLWFANYYEWYSDDTFDLPSSRQYMLGQWSRGGDLLALAVENYPTVAVPGTTYGLYHNGANSRRGVAIAPTRRKLYLLFGPFANAQSLLEYDLDTGVSRVCDQAFGDNVTVDEISPIDLCWDEARDRLWVVEPYDSNGDDMVSAYAYNPDAFTWQTSVTGSPHPTAPDLTVELFEDFIPGLNPTSEVGSFAVSGDTIYFAAPRYDDNQWSLWSVPVAGGDWTYIAGDPDWGQFSNAVMDMIVAEAATANIVGSFRRRRTSFDL